MAAGAVAGGAVGGVGSAAEGGAGAGITAEGDAGGGTGSAADGAAEGADCPDARCSNAWIFGPKTAMVSV